MSHLYRKGKGGEQPCYEKPDVPRSLLQQTGDGKCTTAKELKMQSNYLHSDETGSEQGLSRCTAVKKKFMDNSPAQK